MGRAATDVEEAPRLTHAGSIRMSLIAPAGAAAPLATTFFRLSCDEEWIRDVQPSSLGIFAVMARGGGHLHFLDGRVEPSHPLTVITPTDAAATFVVQGPWELCGAMLSPVGWASLTGRSAAVEGNRLHDAREYLPGPLVAAGEGILRDFDRLSDAEISERLSNGLLAAARPLPEAHVRFIQTMGQWLARSLSPEVADLPAMTGYSGRQVQRLAERYFGLTPKALARKYRALRAAVLLSRPDASADDIAPVQEHFYDQSHMIRELRRFAGRTPARIADPDTPYLASFMSLRDFGEPGVRMAPIPSDLRA
ncbi:helix-turn-helix domain-containing protein [Tsuneonella sp. HG249]